MSETNSHSHPDASSLAGAIIRHPHLGLLLQLRDDIAPTYPHHWGLFGGHMEEGESPEVAVWRELEEELQLTPEMVSEWWLGHASPLPEGGQMYIYYMTTMATPNDLVLGEGEAMHYAQITDLDLSRPYLGHPFTELTLVALQSYLETFKATNSSS